MNLTRRAALQLAASAIGMPALSGAAEPAYRHRGYLGWITDLDPRPDPHAAWPSFRLDPPLVEEYKQTFQIMRSLGYNNAVIWGLYVTRYWPVDIPTAVTPERGKLVQQIIDAAHGAGLRVVSGLGVFSWGFEELIRAYPALSRTNPMAMCASNPDSWKWMEKITDFVFTRFPIDGVSMQSADLGRCNCKECSRFSDSEYHSRINVREAEYIRSKWPGKIVAVSGWGMKFEDPASLPYMRKMAEHLDYLIDVTDSTRQRGDAYRREVIQSLKCDFGTIGGPLVEPPQHWERDRWFLPTAKAQGEHLEKLAADSGRACEYFFHIRANPGDEVSFYVAGKVLSNPAVPWRTHLKTTMQDLYKTKRASVTEDLAALFVRAEEAYFSNTKTVLSGDISLEPLVEDFPGPPIYLTKRMDAAQRKRYGSSMKEVADGFLRIAPEVPEKTRIQKILRCIENVQRELVTAAA